MGQARNVWKYEMNLLTESILAIAILVVSYSVTGDFAVEVQDYATKTGRFIVEVCLEVVTPE